MLRFLLPKIYIYLRSVYHIRIVLIPIFTNGYIFIHLQEAGRFPSYLTSLHHQATSLITDLVLSSSMSQSFVVLKTILLNLLLSPFGKSQTSFSACCLDWIQIQPIVINNYFFIIENKIFINIFLSILIYIDYNEIRRL